ncbi:MAG: hypothetical protein KA191_17195 [Verrucomicrobia bacterium]|jgi:hypothetical protein|nr:hypothetical protein [Verrucomicrobiota bacterium]OQC63308.1 MAG: hypothetical protein BWX48_03298 [Verrucomicrobia bacterium ADurb.Bin006]MDI9380812.1 hypothetical protein [Verrucomicrobiota bacterium]NMD20651.1 hypothetical protein [Verrucomicrobiota bacterium]HOA62672.1 hypothetical protein [Verrucomicrobiota bacterium]
MRKLCPAAYGFVVLVLGITFSALVSAQPAAARKPMAVPEDFPRFVVPGQEKPMQVLRELYWLHYQPAGPLIPLWDEWLPMSTLWPARGSGVELHKMRGRWFSALAGRGMSSEGYIHTHQHDYGWTFLNNEAVYYDFATPDQARSIRDWISGRRIVEGDTSTGPDIYRWRFGPRATTRRNIDYYFWGWSNPEDVPWGYQVQDGGSVLGFSYHDRDFAGELEPGSSRAARATSWQPQSHRHTGFTRTKSPAFAAVSVTFRAS